MSSLSSSTAVITHVNVVSYCDVCRPPPSKKEIQFKSSSAHLIASLLLRSTQLANCHRQGHRMENKTSWPVAADAIKLDSCCCCFVFAFCLFAIELVCTVEGFRTSFYPSTVSASVESNQI
jgi:hypothetical protein